ncbi:TolC family outer membrane protein [Sphingomonas zeae]
MPDTPTPFRRGAVALCLMLAGAASNAESQTLTEAYRAALAHDPEIAQSLAERDAGLENDALARSLFRPKIQVQANAGYTDTNIDVTVSPLLTGITPPGGTGVSAGGLVQLQQPIIDGEASSQRRQLRAGSRAAEAQFDAQRQQLALRVAQAFFDVQRSRDALATVQAQEASARREQQAAQARFDAGRAKITDVREAQARGDGAAAQVVTLTAQVALAGARYRELTGADPDLVLPLRADVQPRVPQRSLADWQSQSIDTSPVVVARQRQRDAAQAKISQYSWGSQAKVSAVGLYGYSRRSGGDDDPRSAVRLPDHVSGAFAGVQLRMPLYTGGAVEAQRRQAAAEARAADRQVEVAMRDVRLQTQQAWLAQTSGADKVAALRTALASAQLQERAAITGREVGVRTQSDVIAAQAQTFDIRRQLGDAMRDYELARLQLHAAGGGLTEERLAEIDADLQPTS